MLSDVLHGLAFWQVLPDLENPLRLLLVFATLNSAAQLGR
jgi:hypothetical protein